MSSLINERIRKYRKEKKCSQGKLAQKLGIKTSTYSQMEREGNVTADMVLKIAKALCIDPALIYFDEKTENPAPEIFTFRSPDTIEETLYGKPETKPVEEEPKNNLPFDMTNTEKSIITIYHNLPKAQQKEIREFIQNIRERGR